MKIKVIALLIAIVLVATIFTIFYPLGTLDPGTDFYVSSSLGNDAWSGMVPYPTGDDGPWQTMSKVNDEMQSGTNIIQNGDNIYFLRGDTFSPTTFIRLAWKHGVDGNPMVFDAELKKYTYPAKWEFTNKVIELEEQLKAQKEIEKKTGKAKRIDPEVDTSKKPIFSVAIKK